ncbi:enoyl-CoA hydratase [Rhodococcus sp. NPDC127530]|uniref:enoyl-CoA hydratase n=1 Tax=unclassified Rhodococcus (in: high G+C Gram-positive bacteria) TaxID=192944 RepID=UPI00363FEFFE
MPQSTRLEHALSDITDVGVATLTIVNAKSLNILGTPVIEDLIDALTELRSNPDIRVLVLRGTGDRAFIGGADIFEMSDFEPDSAKWFISTLRRLCDALRHFPVPVIARLAGWCLGGGLEVALSCDLRIGSADSNYGMPEVHVGIPSVIHAALLPRLVGGSHAAWMLLTGNNIDATTALSWGLLHEVAAEGELDARIARTTHTLAGLGPEVLRQQKRLLREWEELPLTQAIDESVDAFGHAFSTGEPRKFMNQFKKDRSKDVSR